LDFSGLAGKNHEFGFQTFLVGITFCGFHVQYLKVTKMESYMVVFVTLFTTNFIEAQQCKKRGNFLLDFVGGNLFLRDLIIADQ